MDSAAWKRVCDERGQTLVEYGLVIVLVSIAAIVAIGVVALTVGDSFSAVTSLFSSLVP